MKAVELRAAQWDGCCNIPVTLIDQLSKLVNRLLSNVTRLDCRAHGKNEVKAGPNRMPSVVVKGCGSFAVPSFHPVKRLSPMFWLSLPKTLSAHTNALIGKLIADRDQLEAAESKIGKCK
jgi:hypothetical protein